MNSSAAACLSCAVLFSLLLPGSVAALQSGTMRCRDGIVSTNDTLAEVVKKCGSPTFQDRREETRSYGRYGRSYETVTIDVWTYNFGSYEFMYEVTFQNGRVTKVDSLDTGY